MSLRRTAADRVTAAWIALARSLQPRRKLRRAIKTHGFTARARKEVKLRFIGHALRETQRAFSLMII
jgi:hypothetical protein